MEHERDQHFAAALAAQQVLDQTMTEAGRLQTATPGHNIQSVQSTSRRCLDTG